MRRITAVLFSLALVAVVSPIAAQRAPKTTDRVSRGERDYRAFGCAACHGTTGSGGGWQGPRLTPDPLQYEAFIAQLREPADKMPRYTNAVLSDAQAAEMHAYLRSVKPGPRAADIPMLNR